MKEEFIDKIKDCSLNMGIGMGLIMGVFLMIFISRVIIMLEASYILSTIISAILVIVFASFYCVSGAIVRRKLKSEGNWHEHDASKQEGVKE